MFLKRDMTEKKYLGDGAYLDWQPDGTLILTTENGIQTTNRIVLEPELVVRLESLIEERRRKVKEL